MATANFYANVKLDRLDPSRNESHWLTETIFKDSSKLLLCWRNRHLMMDESTPAVISPTNNRDLIELADETVLLGQDDDGFYWFGLDYSRLSEEHRPLPSEVGASWRDLRAIGTLLNRDTGALLGYFNSLMRWHRRHRYCGSCGSPTNPSHAGHTRRCSNPDCDRPQYPRTDPAVIMLIERDDQILLGRQSWWNEGMYSLLAGYVEPGESLEDAVRREVAEEVGVQVTNIRYHSSQPWPFSSSIMLGFCAEAVSTDINLNRDELEHARWFTRQELSQSQTDTAFHLPRKDAIARRIIQEWINSG